MAATGDCLLLTYYFPLRPGECSGSPRTHADQCSVNGGTTP